MALIAKKIIHINQHNIRHNIKDENNPLPVVTVKFKGKTYTAFSVEILGSSQVLYPMDKKLSCGARVWISTIADVQLKDKEGNIIITL